MTTTNFNIYNRINCIRDELLQYTFNEIQILIGIKNILFNIDEMEMVEIRNNLISYYNLNPTNEVNNEIINYITNNDNSLYSINSLLNVWLNESSNFQPTFNNYLPTQNFLDIPPIFNSMNYFEYNFNYHNNNSLYELFPNNTINLPSNQIGDIDNNAINDFENFTEYINNISNYTNNNNEDVPLVIKDCSLDKLKVKKYSDIPINLKDKNKICMIKFEDFKEQDYVRILPCEHIFSLYEIDNWLKNNSYKCPICRNPCGEYFAKVN